MLPRESKQDFSWAMLLEQRLRKLLLCPESSRETSWHLSNKNFRKFYHRILRKFYFLNKNLLFHISVKPFLIDK